MPQNPIEPLLSPAEAAKLLGISVRTLERYRAAGSGPLYCKVSERRVGYEPQALREFIASRRRANTSDRGERPAA